MITGNLNSFLKAIFHYSKTHLIMKILCFIGVLGKAILTHNNGAKVVKVHQSISAKDLLFLCGIFAEIRGNKVVAKNSRTRHEGIPSLSYFESPEDISHRLFYFTLAHYKLSRLLLLD